MTSSELLLDAFGRVDELVRAAVGGLSVEQLTFRPDGHANSIAWLVWHLTRIQDDHLAAPANTEQIWTSQGWAERFGFSFDPSETGYGHGPADVAAVTGTAELLTGYHAAVHERTCDFVRELSETDLGRVVDRSWDPPVTLAVRLVSVISDGLQHAGQAAYLRGLALRL
ncbi:MAG: DUF664 domain-containing protein [Candidatus Nanopelagicales bacterium]